VSAITPFTMLLFCVLVFAVLAVVGFGLRRAHWGWLPLAGLVLLYIAVPAVLARAGALDRYTPLPAPALLLLLSLTTMSAIVAFGPLGAKAVAVIPVGAIVLLQAFRIGVEWLLHRLYLQGAVPVQMTYSGRNFDILSGLTGLALGAWILNGRSVPRAVLLAWNVLGLGLLLNIIVVAVLSTPVPFRGFTEGPPNLLPSTFPFIWLPSFLVQVALVSHFLVFRKVAR